MEPDRETWHVLADEVAAMLGVTIDPLTRRISAIQATLGRDRGLFCPRTRIRTAQHQIAKPTKTIACDHEGFRDDLAHVASLGPTRSGVAQEGRSGRASSST
jgi:hypothetical protein